MNAQKFRRFLASAASLVVGAASFALSFVALSQVAASTGAVPASLAWLVPVVIDGGVICGSAIIWSASYEHTRRPRFPFAFTGVLVIISVVVNAAHAGPAPLAKLIASLPPLILLGTLELVAAQGRAAHRTDPAQTDATTTGTVAPTSAASPAQLPVVPAVTDGAANPAAVATRTPRPRATATRRSPSRGSTASVPAVSEVLTRRPLRVSAEPAELGN